MRSLFRYAAVRAPQDGAVIQRVLTMSGPRTIQSPVAFLTKAEVDALLAESDRATWAGRRDCATTKKCSSLGRKRVTPHTLHHTAAMRRLEAGVDTSAIALWLGHEGTETTQIHLCADLGIKERALARTTQADFRAGRYRPPDSLLAFLESP